ncbi:hypothetical protein CGMCC3_g5901 [Colletotrichum fructicola]|nr:uncharacterized protein CGMCC3_g5901 [Colletotrichum fructicola]KAE9577935.1 hypothetical protein CGMCC3_g5901 [Colletotrichum fructicola]
MVSNLVSLLLLSPASRGTTRRQPSDPQQPSTDNASKPAHQAFSAIGTSDSDAGSSLPKPGAIAVTITQLQLAI